MEEHNAVSLWVGTAPSKQILEEYVTANYSEDGDYVSPQFCKDFGIHRFDDDFREVAFYTTPSASLRELLRGCSYDETVIPRFEALCGATLDNRANAIILLYNFRDDTKITEGGSDGIRFRYAGTIAIA